jgi:Flp pilus assembly pilin Flp
MSWGTYGVAAIASMTTIGTSINATFNTVAGKL